MTGRDRSRSIADSTLLALAIVVACGAMYALVARFALDAFPYAGDEYSLVLQSELFARGLIKAPAPVHAEWLRVDHVILDAWVHSKYPPAAALLLAAGVRMGVPWLVTPLEAVVALLVVWLTTRRLLGPRPALVALAALGLAPLFAYQAATFYAHTASTMFLALAFGGVAAWSRTKRPAWLWLIGAAIGCDFLTRPVDAILFGAAMFSLRSSRAVIVAAAGAVPFIALTFFYQKVQFGSPFVDGYHVYQPTLAALYGAASAANPILPAHLWSPLQIWNHLDVYRALVVDWTVPGTALVALFGAFALGPQHPARPMRTFAVTLLAINLAALLPTIADADDGARPRYLSIALIPLAFLTAAGLPAACAALASRFGPRARTAVIAMALVFAPAQLAAFLVGHIPQVWKREGLFRAVEAAAVRDAVVVVRAKYPSRYARNGGLFDRPVLYLSPPADTRVDTIAAAFPGRAVWEAHEGEPWTLTRVR